jgi:TonB family protein
VFTQGIARQRTRSDAYTAAAYVAIESLRPELHECEEEAKRAGASLFARATLSVDVDAAGRALHVSVDDWKGSQDLLACAAQVLKRASFPPPPTGKGRVVAPIVYNPKLEAQLQF